MNKKIVLYVRNLSTAFETHEGIGRAVENVSFKIHQGEILGLVGESGCGKSITARSIMGLISKPGKIVNGEIFLNGENLLKKNSSELRKLRGDRLAMIFQDPMSSLNPVMNIKDQIYEVFKYHRKRRLNYITKNDDTIEKDMWKERYKITCEILHSVGLKDTNKILKAYPHELSGGMQQRVMIAMGLANKPNLLLADEPTTALDVTIQAGINKLIKGLVIESGTSVLLITHDFGVVSEMCDSVAVMYSGEILEYGTVLEVIKRPKHPYTIGLLNCIPRRGEKISGIPGFVPSIFVAKHGCSFFDRCSSAMPICKVKVPNHINIESGWVKCHLFS